MKEGAETKQFKIKIIQTLRLLKQDIENLDGNLIIGGMSLAEIAILSKLLETVAYIITIKFKLQQYLDDYEHCWIFKKYNEKKLKIKE